MREIALDTQAATTVAIVDDGRVIARAHNDSGRHHAESITPLVREALEAAGIVFDNVIDIEIPDEAIVARMEGRRFCHSCGATYHIVNAPSKVAGVCDKCGGELEQRDDDKPETVKRRLEVYHTETEPLKDFYAKRGVLRPVENQSTIEATAEMVNKALGL